jgi:hypothetical protein
MGLFGILNATTSTNGINVCTGKREVEKIRKCKIAHKQAESELTVGFRSKEDVLKLVIRLLDMLFKC